jgi:SAM-dependent methyltransferase
MGWSTTARPSTRPVDWHSVWKEIMVRDTTIAYDDRGALKQWSPAEAESFYEKMNPQYAETVVGLVKPSAGDRVLDVGCGPGTLAIPLARLVGSVTALDTSEGMLGVLKRRAGEEGLGNIRCVKRFWREAEPGVDIEVDYDVVVASNCVNLLGALEHPTGSGRVRVEWDLEDALLRLNRVGKRVCVTMPVTDFLAEDAAAFDALGRKYHPAPTNIHVHNVMYHLGFKPSANYFLRLNRGDKAVEKYLDSLNWMLSLSPEERERARRGTESVKAVIENSVHVWTMLTWTRE